MSFYKDWSRHAAMHGLEKHRTNSVLPHLMINSLVNFKSLESPSKKYLILILGFCGVCMFLCKDNLNPCLLMNN